MSLFHIFNNTIFETDQLMIVANAARIEFDREMAEFGNVCKDQLDNTVGKATRGAKNALEGLASILNRFENLAVGELQELRGQAQQLANSLPLASTLPQLTSSYLHYLVLDNMARVSFRGNFPCSAKTGFEPSFLLGGKECELSISSTQELRFKVPQDVFNGPSGDSDSHIIGKLSLPYDDGVIRSHLTKFNYSVDLGVLPAIAGKGSVEYVKHKTERAFRIKKTSFEYDGNNFHPESLHTILTRIYPEPGWIIDVSTPPKIIIRNKEGEHYQEIASCSPSEIVLKVELNCKRGAHTGVVKMDVEFDEYQDRTEPEKRLEDFLMNWKDSKLLEPKEGEVISKVVFEDCKHTRQEFGAPSIDDRSVLKVEAEGNGKWKVWAELPLALNTETAKRLQTSVMLANLSKEIIIEPRLTA